MHEGSRRRPRLVLIPLVSTAEIYTFKASPYSSHSLLLDAIPSNGAGKTLLDVGCAAGHLANQLAQRGFRVTGVERPGGFPPLYDSFRLVEADLDNGLPHLGEQYDFVLCADVLEHLRDPGNLLRHIFDVLTPGGVVIASLPNSGNIWFRLNVLFGRFPQEDKGLFDRTHLRFFMWSGWQTLFREAGFELTNVRPSGIPVGLTVPAWQDSLPVRLAEIVCYGMACIWKTLFAYQFIIRAHPVRNHES